MKVSTDRRHHEVVVRMDPEDARTLAGFLGDYLPPTDLARRYVDQLRDAADRLEPPPETGS